MERDGLIKKNLPQKDSNLEQLLDKDQEQIKEVNNLPISLDNNNNSNKSLLARPHPCPTVRHNYWSSSELNLLPEEQEDFLVSKDSSRLLMITTPRTWMYMNSRKLAEISELVLKIKMLKDSSESSIEMEVDPLTTMNF